MDSGPVSQNVGVSCLSCLYFVAPSAKLMFSPEMAPEKCNSLFSEGSMWDSCQSLLVCDGGGRGQARLLFAILLTFKGSRMNHRMMSYSDPFGSQGSRYSNADAETCRDI